MKTFFKISIVLPFFLVLIGACQNEKSRKVQNIETFAVLFLDTSQANNEIDKKIQNIETFARLYGYARWFHPSDEAQGIDWGKFAVLGVQKVENIQSDKELLDTLFRLFSPIVQGLKIYEAGNHESFNPHILLSPDSKAKSVAWQHYGVYLNEKSNIYKSERSNKKSIVTKLSNLISHSNQNFDLMPQFGEIINEPIGNNLICIIPLVLLTNDASTYPKTEISSLSRLKSEISNINMGSNFNMQVNLASVVISWNVLQHFFPYFDVIDTDWNKVLDETLESALENKEKKDYFITMSQMFAKIDDGHGIVFGEKMYHLPIKTELIENKIVITASNDNLLKRGDIIKEVDGKTVMETLAEKEKIISGSPQLRRHRALNILGSKFDSGETNLVIERDDNEQNVTISNSSNGSMFFNPVDERKYLSETIVEIEPGIYYVNMTNCTEDDFDKKIDMLANAKAVIYDQRGGNRLGFFQIIPHLIEKSVNSTWWHIPQTVYPDRKDVVFNKSNWSIQPKKPLFRSKTIIINVPSVVSSGETEMGIIDHYNLATTVGETTAGCNGNINTIYLPYDYTAWFTGMKVMKHDGSQLYREGFQPDYPVNKTIQAVKEGRDEYLEKALEIARLE
ncbi:hypothetical protein LJC68_10330 [Bacteroidales bacterium OttesenSCG-928-B11]|nr:hypothetical protein [Bacteroidales bacterium OttesenSCG-928-C03]MDL2313258.1 hypothetical protein [Bacteroidales bacterium OttesenSCG-928-B11]